MENKKSLSEEDIKLQYITPALNGAGWDNQHMRMEYAFTDGRIIFQGQSSHARKAKKYADYLLQAEPNKFPIAIVEAKDNNHAVSDGIGQAKTYADILDLKFAYSSNGDGFTEYDFITGQERNLALDEFPTPEQLIERLREVQRLTPEAQKIVDTPYYFDAYSHEPRYYQRIAIDRTVEAVAKGQKRILLVMATGTGKTFTSFQIIHRLTKSGAMKKVLYLADRNVLIDQTMTQDFRPFKSKMTKIQNRNMDSSYEIYMALYQQLVSPDEDKPNPYTEFQPTFFDLIIVDECHRGSAKDDSQWKDILKYFSSATQIGMTATPKAVDGANNLDYFGEPIYSYSLKQGIEDGFLAPYRVTNSFLSVDLTGYIPREGEEDLNGKIIEPDYFSRKDFGRDLAIRKRREIVAWRITQMLKQIGRMTKTIVFCPDIDEAEAMRQLLTNFNSDLCQKDHRYVMKITGDDYEGKRQLDNFIDVDQPYPTIVTTSEMLSTGVDCKTCGLIVIDKEIQSMTEFKQIVGRGTRIREDKGKWHFEILDFRNVTELFHDPEFDGDPEPPTGGGTGEGTGEGEPNPPKPKPLPEPHEKYLVDGVDIQIDKEYVSFLDANGKLTKESYTDFTKKRILGKYPTLNDFLQKWTESERKDVIVKELKEYDVLIDAIREQNPSLADADIFDIVCHVAFDQKPMTRKERANKVRKSDYFSQYGEQARKVLEALLDKYADTGILEIENVAILLTPQLAQFGKPQKIMKYFGGMNGYRSAVKNMETRIYAA